MLQASTTRFLSLLWKEYDYQLLLVLATLASLIVESVVASTWSALRIIPQGLLIVCLVYMAKRTFAILRSVYPAVQIPYSICIGKSSDWFDNFARRQQEQRLRAIGVEWPEIQKIYRIHQSDWVFLSSGMISEDEEWVQVTRRLLDHFWDLQKRVEGVPVHHLFFVAPPSVAFAFGAIVGRRVPHVAYQHVGNVREPYLPVSDTTARDTSGGFDTLNQRIPRDSYEQITIESDALDGKGRVIVALDFTNHRTNPPYLEQETAKELLRVTHRDGIGHIPTDDWERLAREIASLLLEYSDSGDSIDIYVNTPVSLSFIVGSIVGPVRGIALCEHNAYLQRFVRCLEPADPRLRSADIRMSAGNAVEDG